MLIFPTCVCMGLIAQSCLTLCDPMDCSLSGSSVHGFLQAKILKWVAFPFSRASSWPGDWTQVSHIYGRFFNLWVIRVFVAYIRNIRSSGSTGGSFSPPKYSWSWRIPLYRSKLKTPKLQFHFGSVWSFLPIIPGGSVGNVGPFWCLCNPSHSNHGNIQFKIMMEQGES